MFGISVSTKVPAVGAITNYARAGVGAIVTQARANPLFGLDGLNMLQQGYGAEKTIRALLDSDHEPERRQLSIVDSGGHAAAYTGEGYSVAGNLLVGEATISSMAEAFESSAGEWFPERLMRALEAGQEAGGDRRGRQSAAVYVVHHEPYSYLDLRVDEHADPVDELRRVFEVVRTDLIPLVERLPTRANPEGELGEEILGSVLPED